MMTFAVIAAISLWNKYFYNAVTYEVESDGGSFNATLNQVAFCSEGVKWDAE